VIAVVVFSTNWRSCSLLCHL